MEYFGKNCRHFVGQWEIGDKDAAEFYNKDIKEFEPVLVYCNHPLNKEHTEGNCNRDLCPYEKVENKNVYRKRN